MIYLTKIKLLHFVAPLPRKRLVVGVLLYVALFVIVPVTASGRAAPVNRDQTARLSFTATSPAVAWEYVNKARAAATANRHKDSIRWYLEAVAQHPSLRINLAREIAYQYSRNDEPDSALTWYKTSLAFYPGDVESHLGMARALSRSGRSKEALAYYRAILPVCEKLPLDVRLEIDRVAAWVAKR